MKKMQKAILAAAMTATMGASTSANAATPLSAGAYLIEITGGCFDFGDCPANGKGVFTDASTANQATISGFGSGIVGDGIMGALSIDLAANGDFTVSSYSQDSYLNTTGGTFYLQDQGVNGNGGLMSGTIVGGAITLNPVGRDGIAAAFATTLGLQEWNRDNTSNGLGNGQYATFTTGTSTNRAQGFASGFTVTGSELVDAGAGMWTGTIVSAGNIGQNWGDFDNQRYSEVWDIKITAQTPAVPVPAAVWLFGSGLLGLVGVARRRTSV